MNDTFKIPVTTKLKRIKSILGAKSLPNTVAKQIYEIEIANQNHCEPESQLIEMSKVKSHEILVKAKKVKKKEAATIGTQSMVPSGTIGTQWSTPLNNNKMLEDFSQISAVKKKESFEFQAQKFIEVCSDDNSYSQQMNMINSLREISVNDYDDTKKHTLSTVTR